MRLLLSGPCGVGKSSAAALIVAHVAGSRHLDLDALRVGTDGISLLPGCSVSSLDLEVCVGAEVDACGNHIVLDIGGDTVFRRGSVDNESRLAQLLAFKKAHDLEAVLLDASREATRSRFLSCKSRRPDEFDEPWNDWTEVSRPYWVRAADRVVSTDDIVIGVAAQEEQLIRRILGP